MTEYLGSQKISRSAYAVKTAKVTTAYFGICERDNRPVRFEIPADLGPAAEIPCFAGCTLPVRCERLHAVTTRLECDGSCRSARRPWCECGCGGINHGKVWTQGALLDSREVVESAIAAYRAEQVKIRQRREARAEARARAERNAFDTWAASHQDVVTALEPWWEHRNDTADWAVRHIHAGWCTITEPMPGRGRTTRFCHVSMNRILKPWLKITSRKQAYALFSSLTSCRPADGKAAS